jgi:hypothetical protein
MAIKRDAGSANSRIVKKRETDRLAQRANRERTKQRIALLEEEVDRLKSSNQNAAMLDLMKVVEEQRKENEELQCSLEKIRSIVGMGMCGGGGKSGMSREMWDEGLFGRRGVNWGLRLTGWRYSDTGAIVYDS